MEKKLERTGSLQSDDKKVTRGGTLATMDNSTENGCTSSFKIGPACLVVVTVATTYNTSDTL